MGRAVIAVTILIVAVVAAATAITVIAPYLAVLFVAWLLFRFVLEKDEEQHKSDPRE